MGWNLAIGVFLLALTTLAEPADHGDTNRVKTLEKGTFGGIQQALQVVVTNQAQWTDLWQKHTAQKLPKPTPPEIDFQKESVIVVTLGRKNTGGYGVEITEVRRSGDKAEVIFTTKEPKPGGFNIQALTAPFHIVRVPRLEGEVKFKAAENKQGS